MTVKRPADRYEQRLERLAHALRQAVAAHDAEHSCAGEWCEHRLEVVDNVMDVAFLPGEVEAFLAECPYVWEWTPNGGMFVSETVREAAVDALRYDARERLYRIGGDPLTFELLDPEATWEPEEAR